MKLTKRIFVVLVMMALLVSGFAFASSADFTEDNIDDILEYYYPKYVKEDFNSLTAGDAYSASATLDGSAALEIMTSRSEIVQDASNEFNKSLKYYYVAEDGDKGYYGYKLSLNEAISEVVFSIKVRVDKGRAQKSPTLSINLSAYDESGSPVGEDSLVTPVMLDFETGKVYYARVSASNAAAFSSVPVADFSVATEEWYTITLIVNCQSGFYNFTVAPETGAAYESSVISLGEAECFNEIAPTFTCLPASSGVSCYFDDFVAYRGTFIRGDESLSEITPKALYNISEFIRNNELDAETRLRIIEVYKAIIASGYVPVFTNDFTIETVTELYESAIAYIPATYTELFCEEAAQINPQRSYSRRVLKVQSIEKYFPLMNGENFYLENINTAIWTLDSKIDADVAAALNAVNEKLAAEGISEEEKEAYKAEAEAITATAAAVDNAINAYKIALTKNENAENRVSDLESALSELIYDYEESYNGLETAISVLVENEELLAKLRAGMDAYKAELKSLNEVREDSEAFMTFMQTFDITSRDYTYMTDAYKQLSEYASKDNSYNYPNGVYQYVDEYETLKKRVEEVVACVSQFQSAVLIMQEQGASFDRIYNTGYLSAKAVYAEGVIHPEVDVASVPGLVSDIAKYLEIEATLSVTIKASENFIASVNTAKFNTIYETKKAALAAAKQILATDANINDAYPGVKAAKDDIALIEADIVALETAAANYIAAVSAISGQSTFSAKRAAINNALSLQESGNVVGIAGVAEANSALANYSAELLILEGNSKTFIESVEKLNDDSLTLAQRRALIIIADKAKVNAEPTYDGVAAAKAAIEEHKAAYKASVEAINDDFNKEITNNASVAGASVNQSRYYTVIEVIKLLLSSFRNNA